MTVESEVCHMVYVTWLEQRSSSWMHELAHARRSIYYPFIHVFNYLVLHLFINFFFILCPSYFCTNTSNMFFLA